MKREEVAVGDHVSIDGKLRHFYDVLFVLIVPAESVLIVAGKTQDRSTCRNFHHARSDWTFRQFRRMRLGDFILVRQLVQHVGQGFRVHQPVFDRHIQQHVRGNFIVRVRRQVGQAFVDGLPDLPNVVPYLRAE